MSATGEGPDRRHDPPGGAEPGGTGGPGREQDRDHDATVGDGPGDDAEHGAHAAVPSRPRTPLTQQLGRVTLVVLAVLFVVFAAANSQPVDFSWIVGTTEVVERPDGEVVGGVPLIILLVVALLVGAAIGALVEWQFLRARRTKGRDRG
jgi:uncharacterized integral membrane protein